MKVNKKLIFVIALFCFLLPFKVSASGYKVILDDEADLFSESEEEQLKEKMQELVVYGNIMVVTISDNSTSTSSYAEWRYHSEFGTSSGTMFIIDMDNRNIYIFSDGNNYDVINDRIATIITDNIYRYASQEKYYECMYEGLDQAGKVLSGQRISQPMKYISNFILALILSASACFIYTVSKFRLKKFSRGELETSITKSFNVNSVEVRKIGQHRVYSPQSSDSGGGGSSGGGGGGGGGGGSSGGGGGHSF